MFGRAFNFGANIHVILLDHSFLVNVGGKDKGYDRSDVTVIERNV